MHILGVTHPMSWNNAACLLQGGRLVAMAEEERLIRVKYAQGVPPLRSIEHCLRAAGCTLDDVDLIAVGWDRALARTRKERTIWEFLQKGLPVKPEDPRLRHVRHHLAHAVSAYYASGWDRAAVITLDGSGEQEAGLIAAGEGDAVRVTDVLPGAGSFGYLYGKVTEALGFTAHADEGSVMALAAYGRPDASSLDVVDLAAEPPQVNKRRLRRFLDSLPRRRPGAPITDAHRDLAATLQASYTAALIATVRLAVRRTGCRDVALAGGCALNCAANGAVLAAGACDRLFVQPAAHDAGTALGAAAATFHDVVGVRPEIRFTHAYHGPDLDAAEVERVVRHTRWPGAARPDDLPRAVAALLAEGRTVGWCRGRAEVGPRALGARSILADPRNVAMRDRLNRLKGRQEWRPFGPTLLADAAPDYLATAPRIESGNPASDPDILPAPPVVHDSPFMLLALYASARARDEMPAAIHVDGTMRPHTLRREVNPVLYDTILRFRERTGVAGVLNTSFNLEREPIVDGPRAALRTFAGSPLDALVLGDWLLVKER